MEPFNSRRAAAHARNAMVASSQPLAAQVGLQVLKDGGNAVDAAIAVAAVVNVTEPMMNGLGGDAFILVYWQGKLHGLNASGRCPHAMTRKTFNEAGWKRMPQVDWGSVSVPGAPDRIIDRHLLPARLRTWAWTWVVVDPRSRPSAIGASIRCGRCSTGHVVVLL